MTGKFNNEKAEEERENAKEIDRERQENREYKRYSNLLL